MNSRSHPSATLPTAPVHPGCDFAALERFAFQLLCDAGTSMPASSAARLRASALCPEALSRRANHFQTNRMPVAYQLWLDYLFELDTLLHYTRFTPHALTALELRGLKAIARARARFLRSHTLCPHCEAANPRAARHCAHCHKEL